MSFELVCENCGAVSGPSVAICPYCKTSFTRSSQSNVRPEVVSIVAACEEGNLDEAIALAQLAEKQNPDIVLDPHFSLLYARLLIECEGPSAKIKSVLNRILLQDAKNLQAKELLELITAKAQFSPEKNDIGEQKMRELIKKNPDFDLALFLLGAHLFWVSGDTQESVAMLERCIKLKPNFLRAWACLGSIYQKIGNRSLADRCFQRCLSLEVNPEMKSFFQKQLSN